MYKYKALKINGVRIDEHRLIIERHLGRKLGRNEVVHHENANKRDNRIENLVVMSLSEHSSLHSKGHFVEDSLKEKIRTKLKEFWNDRPSECDIPVVQIDLDGRVIGHFRSARDAQRKTGHSNTHIIECCKGQRKTHHHFFWMYEKDAHLVKSDTSSDN